MTEEARPQVGDGITIHVGSDRYPATIVSVSKSGDSFKFAYDRYEVLPNPYSKDGTYEYGEDKEYEFFPVEVDLNDKTLVEAKECPKGSNVWRTVHSKLPISKGRRMYLDPTF